MISVFKSAMGPCVLFVWGLAVSLHAAIITVPFEGKITSSQLTAIPLGTPFSGSFTYDSDALPISSGEYTGSYRLPFGAIKVNLLDSSIETGDNRIFLTRILFNRWQWLGSVSLGTEKGAVTGPLAQVGIDEIEIRVTDFGYDLPDVRLPNPFPPLNSFSQPVLLMFWDNRPGPATAGQAAYGGMTSAATVPEPGTALLLGPALVLLPIMLRHFKNRRTPRG